MVSRFIADWESRGQHGPGSGLACDLECFPDGLDPIFDAIAAKTVRLEPETRGANRMKLVAIAWTVGIVVSLRAQPKPRHALGALAPSAEKRPCPGDNDHLYDDGEGREPAGNWRESRRLRQAVTGWRKARPRRRS